MKVWCKTCSDWIMTEIDDEHLTHEWDWKKK